MAWALEQHRRSGRGSLHRKRFPLGIAVHKPLGFRLALAFDLPKSFGFAFPIHFTLGVPINFPFIICFILTLLITLGVGLSLAIDFTVEFPFQ